MDGMANQDAATGFLREIWTALEGPAEATQTVRFTGEGALPSSFAVTGLAAASIGAAGLAAAELTSALPQVTVDRRLASLWFAWTLKPDGWTMPAPWDAVAGDYRTADGWIKLHTNAPHHRAAALSVLRAPNEREAVAKAVAGWQAEALESAIIAAGGCSAVMRSRAEWATHPQGMAVGAEPLLAIQAAGDAPALDWRPSSGRPLAGLRVLDLTRILAGPIATRFLAMLGAEVLRIDPPGWDEPSVIPEVALGKNCARLDLKTEAGRETLRDLLRGAHVMIHGYRSDALEKLGLGAEARRALNPGLVDVCLDAYGWSGPWARRRGFDSLVQMSSGIAEAGLRAYGSDKPTPLPVQALDHATGYLLAAAALRGLTRRLATGRGSLTRCSLARTAALLAAMPSDDLKASLAPAGPADFLDTLEATSWGRAHRMRPPLAIEGVAIGADRPAMNHGTAEPRWS
ncbi:CoA transferase [Roseococcus sp. YIM B11640]|uniref:CoA transferase n=1 Tax=Roseococcus sp. YIM B11640 TaxID=3133973 RepID=UPI003C7B4087